MDKKIIKHIQELIKINNIFVDAGTMLPSERNQIYEELHKIRTKMLKADHIYDEEQAILKINRVKA